MQKISNIVFLMLFLTLSCRIVIIMMPQLGLPIVSTLLAAGSIFSIFYCALNAYSLKEVVVNITYLLLFLIYSGFVCYQAFFSNIIALDECLGIDDQSTFIRTTFVILFLSLLANQISKHLDFVKFAKFTVILNLVFIAIYNWRIGFTWYTISYGLSRAEAELYLPSGYISGLVMNGFVGLFMCCNLFLYNKWAKNKFLNYFIFISFLVIGLVLQALLVERGPLLFFAITLLITLIAKGILSPRYGIIIALTLLLTYIFSEDLLALAHSWFPAISDKFTDTTGAGRYGEGSLTTVAIKQIMNHPLYGYHCRLTDSTWYGVYPHNVILELVMTVGVFIAAPIVVLLYKAFKQSYILIKYDCPESLIAILFIFRFLRLMTSGTIVTDIQFWFSFAFVLATIKYIDFSTQNK